jgi:hypothetical protein
MSCAGQARDRLKLIVLHPTSGLGDGSQQRLLPAAVSHEPLSNTYNGSARGLWHTMFGDESQAEQVVKYFDMSAKPASPFIFSRIQYRVRPVQKREPNVSPWQQDGSKLVGNALLCGAISQRSSRV